MDPHKGIRVTAAVTDFIRCANPPAFMAGVFQHGIITHPVKTRVTFPI